VYWLKAVVAITLTFTFFGHLHFKRDIMAAGCNGGRINSTGNLFILVLIVNGV